VPGGSSGARRCLVRGCENKSDQGEFEGDLCRPCSDFVLRGKGRYSQAWRNMLEVARVEACKVAVGLAWHFVGALDPTRAVRRPPTVAEIVEILNASIGDVSSESRGDDLSKVVEELRSRWLK